MMMMMMMMMITMATTIVNHRCKLFSPGYFKVQTSLGQKESVVLFEPDFRQRCVLLGKEIKESTYRD